MADISHKQEHDEIGTVEMDFEEAVERFRSWRVGDFKELKELGILAQGAYNADDYGTLEALCLALLQHDQLPAFYKAKMYTYLSMCENKAAGQAGRLFLADSWIMETRRQQIRLGWMPDEVEAWSDIIQGLRVTNDADYKARKKTRLEKEKEEKEKEKGASLRSGANETFASSPWELGMMDGAMDEAPPSEVLAGEVLAGEGPAGGEVVTVDTIEATASEKDEANKVQQQAAYDRAKAKDAEEQRVRHQVSKLSKSVRMKRSNASFQKGEGSRGALSLRGVLRPKPSISQLFTTPPAENNENKDGEEDEVMEG
ncbi:hypothetical protein LTR08_001949 [Meristemomyces frigidus]|nr:hypothetical protein LTR08_001949 [Meristemomyces frigidus]